MKKNETTFRGVGRIPFCLLLFLSLCHRPARASGDSGAHFRFVVMGCAHMGLCEPRHFEDAVEAMRGQHPDFALFLGDMVDVVGKKAAGQEPQYDNLRAMREDVRLSSAAVESLWRDFDRITARLGVPVYDIPGVRSIPHNNVSTAERPFLRRYGRRYRVFEHQNSLFICLDSEAHNRRDFKRRGLIEGDQLEFLKKALAGAARYENVFVAMNKSSGLSPADDSRWFATVHPLLKGKVSHVFSADIHALARVRLDDVDYVGTSGAPCWRNPARRYSFPHFLLVDVRGRDVSVRVVPLAPMGIGEFSEYDRGADVVDRIKRLTDLERIAMMRVDQVVERISVQPGMTIVDIGAGTGLFAVPFARALRGQGRVYATELEPDLVAHMKREAEEKGLGTLAPVLVTSKGLDPFYRQHSFDLIFLANTYEAIVDPGAYFRELLPSLAKGTGRLYVLNRRYDPDFTEMDFPDFDEVVGILAAAETGHPVSRRLSPKVQGFVHAWQGEGAPAAVREGLVRSLNEMLLDRSLFNELLDYYALKFEKPRVLDLLGIHPTDHLLAQRLLMELDSHESAGAGKQPLSEEDRQSLRRLNRIALCGFLKIHNATDRLNLRPVVLRGEPQVVSTLETAGYRLVRQHDPLPYHYLLEFKRP